MNVLLFVVEVNNNFFLIILKMAQCSRASLTRVQLLGSFWLSVYQRISSALIFCLFVLQSVVKVKLFHMRVQQLVEVFKSSFRGIEKNHRHTNGEKLQIYDFRETITSKINVCGKKRERNHFRDCFHLVL